MRQAGHNRGQERHGVLSDALSYAGDRFAQFSTAPPPEQIRPRMPAYALLGLRAGARTDRYTVTLSADNITNRRGILSASPLTPGAQSATDPFIINIVRPRTCGLSLSANF